MSGAGKGSSTQDQEDRNVYIRNNIEDNDVLSLILDELQAIRRQLIYITEEEEEENDY